MTLKIQNQHRAFFLCMFGIHIFVPISWMCKKQTSVSHSSTEAEIISLDAGSLMDGIPALDLWNLGMKVFHYSQKQSNKTKDSWAQGDSLHHTTSSKRTKNQTKAPTTHDSSDLFHVDTVPSNAKFSQSNAMLYVFEDNEAVIKMIIKGRSPTMRHVSRTHRVALDLLFDRINLDSKIQVRYIDTKHQIADILTKGNFTRDESNNLLHLFNISHFSSLCCAKNFRLVSSTKRMAKRMQEHKKRKLDCGEIQANGDEPGRFSLYKCFICEASRSPGILKAPSRKIGLSGRLGVSASQNSNPDAASSSQGWQRDALLDISTGRLVASDKDQKYLNHQEKNKHRGTCRSWIPRISRKSSNSRRIRRFGTRKSKLATSFPYITLCWSHGEGFLDHENDL